LAQGCQSTTSDFTVSFGGQPEAAWTDVSTLPFARAKAVFEKFKDYVPRQEPASWLAGGKNIVVDRVEWITIADPATASAAL